MVAPSFDAYSSRAIMVLDRWKAWLDAAGVPGIVTEFSVANQYYSNDYAQFAGLLEAYYRRLDTHGIAADFFAASAWTGTTLDPYVAYGKATPSYNGTALDDRVSLTADVPEAHLGLNAGKSYRRGIHVSGGEFAKNGDFPSYVPSVNAFSNQTPGTYMTHYGYPSSVEATVLAAKGYDHIRLPIRWERFAPTLGGALNTTELGRLDASIAACAAAGLKVIIDLHNFAGYYLWNPAQSRGELHVLGNADGVVTQAHLTDFWTRLATYYAGNTTVWAYELMNEPTAMTSAAQWQTMSQAAVTAIRAVDTTHTLLVPGYDFQQMATWLTNHPTPWITDPANKFMYAAHHYFHLTPDAKTIYATGVGFSESLLRHPEARAALPRPTRPWLGTTLPGVWGDDFEASGGKSPEYVFSGGFMRLARGEVELVASPGSQGATVTIPSKAAASGGAAVNLRIDYLVRLKSTPDVPRTRLHFRRQDANNGWYVEVAEGSVGLRKITAGTVTTPTGAADLTRNGFRWCRIQVTARGGRIIVYAEGKKIADVSDGAFITQSGLAISNFCNNSAVPVVTGHKFIIVARH